MIQNSNEAPDFELCAHISLTIKPIFKLRKHKIIRIKYILIHFNFKTPHI